MEALDTSGDVFAARWQDRFLVEARLVAGADPEAFGDVAALQFQVAYRKLADSVNGGYSHAMGRVYAQADSRANFDVAAALHAIVESFETAAREGWQAPVFPVSVSKPSRP